MKKIIGIGIFMATIVCNSHAAQQLISHNETNHTTFNLPHFKQGLEHKKDTILPLAQSLELLEQLSEFELGRFLLMNKGLNGYWTSYIILHGPQKKELSTLEKWVLHDAPSVKATQERFRIFQKILQSRLKDNIKIASVPCGLMDDLLRLDYNNTKNTHLVGIDLDEKSLELAKENAKKQNISQVDFVKQSAWNLGAHQEYDIITSNGLNIYEPDDNKVTLLYQEFNKALKPEGVLVISFLTPPPSLSSESTWKNVNVQDAVKQKAIFVDIIGVNWQCFRTEAKTREQLQNAGFQVLEVIYDTHGIFPSIVAQKMG